MAGRVLVIDDESSIRMACEKILTGAGYQVETAADGEAGVECLRRGDYDVALIDLKMPGLDGMAVLKQGLQLDPHLVAIVITGYPSYESAVEAIKAGAYDYIPKPFSLDELRAVVARGYEKRELEKRTRELEAAQERNLATIARERSRLLTVVECMADGVLVTDREGKLALYNMAAARWLLPGLDAERLLGQPLAAVCSWPELEALAREVMGDRQFRSVTIDLPSEPGQPTYMATAAAVAGDGAEIMGSVVVVRDVTQWRQLERAKSNFVAMVCHEIRAPLSAIAGYLELILGGMGEGEEMQRRILERCRARAEGLVALTQDLVDLSRMEAPVRQMERFALSEVMEDTASLFAQQAERARVNLRLVPAPVPLQVTADRHELARLVGNLISNGVKFNRPGGEVKVTWQQDGNYLRLQVADTGMGISPRHLDRLGEEFYRVRDERTGGIPGTGLGLAIVKNLVRKYHGEMQIESEPEVGTTVTVTLACHPFPAKT